MLHFTGYCPKIPSLFHRFKVMTDVQDRGRGQPACLDGTPAGAMGVTGERVGVFPQSPKTWAASGDHQTLPRQPGGLSQHATWQHRDPPFWLVTIAI